MPLSPETVRGNIPASAKLVINSRSTMNMRNIITVITIGNMRKDRCFFMMLTFLIVASRLVDAKLMIIRQIKKSTSFFGGLFCNSHQNQLSLPSMKTN
jgi:hypothetical protein